jgi:hypothetical protein
MGDDFRGLNQMMRRIRRNKKDNALARAEESLRKAGLEHKTHYVWKGDYLIQITLGEKKWSFWPSSSKWKGHFGERVTQVGIVKLKEDIKLYWKKKNGADTNSDN